MGNLEIYDDVDYQEVWDVATTRFNLWLHEYIDKYGGYPGLDLYTQKVKETAKEVLDCIANDDIKVEDHLEIVCIEVDYTEHAGVDYTISVSSLSSIGDAFLLVYAAEGFDRC